MEYKPIYATYEEVHADLIRQLLEQQGIPCRVRSMKVAGYEGITIGPLGEIRIYVLTPYAQKAVRIIEEAIRDGALWPLGGPVKPE
ncbi:MAG: putative signal transducing protein [Candidatus Methylomirabilales bacterium]